MRSTIYANGLDLQMKEAYDVYGLTFIATYRQRARVGGNSNLLNRTAL